MKCLQKKKLVSIFWLVPNVAFLLLAVDVVVFDWHCCYCEPFFAPWGPFLTTTFLLISRIFHQHSGFLWVFSEGEIKSAHNRRVKFSEFHQPIWKSKQSDGILAPLRADSAPISSDVRHPSTQDWSTQDPNTEFFVVARAILTRPQKYSTLIFWIIIVHSFHQFHTYQ